MLHISLLCPCPAKTGRSVVVVLYSQVAVQSAPNLNFVPGSAILKKWGSWGSPVAAGLPATLREMFVTVLQPPFSDSNLLVWFP